MDFRKGSMWGTMGKLLKSSAAVRSGWRADKFGECNTGPNTGGI